MKKVLFDLLIIHKYHLEVLAYYFYFHLLLFIHLLLSALIKVMIVGLLNIMTSIEEGHLNVFKCYVR